MEEETRNGSATERPPPPLVFRMNENGTGSETVRNVLLDRGWREFIEGEDEEHDWNLWWRNARYRQCNYDDLMPWQRLNHFPKTTAITKKDMLARNMRRMRGVYGASVYNFTPTAFNLPNDYTKFVAEYTKHKEQNRREEKREFWICKPADSSRGRGIFLFEDLSELTYDCSAVVQRYINNPCLIAGYKFDLRLYVLVTSFHPLTIYMFQEGLARFSTDKFDLNSIGNLYSHLTNTSINKYSPNYSTDKERVGQGSKWTLTMLRNYFHQQNIDDEVVWQKITNIVILTLLAQVTSVPKVSGSFELFGFDVIIDEQMKPWLLEVNFNPALTDDCPVDTLVKRSMLNNVIDILGFDEGDGHRGGEQYARLKARQHDSRQRQTLFVPKALPKTYRSSGGIKITSDSSNRGSRRPVESKQTSRNRTVVRKSQSTLGTDRKVEARVSDSKTSLDMGDDYDEEIAGICASRTNLLSKQTTPVGSTKTSNLQCRSQSLSKLSSRESSLDRIRQKDSKSGSVTDFNFPSIEESQKSPAAQKGLLCTREGVINSSTSESPLARVEYNLNKVVSPNDLSSSSNLSSPQTNSRTLDSTDCPTTTAANSPNLVGPQSRNSKSRSNMTSLARGDRRNSQNSVKTGSKPNPIRSTLYSKTVTHKTLMSFKGSPQKKTSGHSWPPARVGDFALLFPFNEVTKRASYPTIDVRTVVKETQKELKRVICLSKAAKKGAPGVSQRASTQRAPKESNIIWAPLKSPTLTVVEA